MREPALRDHLATERSEAIRTLLAHPIIDAADDPDAFRLVVRNGSWLTDYFEAACGWALAVDPAAGYARLAKRPSGTVDVTRPLRRTRGQAVSFDRRRYQLLCLVCAELVRRPVTTVGLLADAVAPTASLDTGRRGERSAFVDALLVLRSWGALRATSGDLESFVDDERANALLHGDTSRLHRLIVSTTAPSTLPAATDAVAAAERLLAEPRYGALGVAFDAVGDGSVVVEEGSSDGTTGGGPGPGAASAGDDGPAERGAASDDIRHRWARHRLARRLLDDPVVYFDDLDPLEMDYASSLGGRRWLRQRISEAGLELEERAEGLLAIDPDAIATDIRFPAPLGNAHQLALLLADRLIETDGRGIRHLRRLDPDQLETEVRLVLDRFPGWARRARDEGGSARLTRQAVDLLEAFGLVRLEEDGAVVGRPALARYRTGAPVVRASPTTPTLWEE